MQVQFEATGPCLGQVSVTVPYEEFDSKVRTLLAETSRQVRVKGFRPGKVPVRMVETLHGAQVRKEARQHFLQKALEQTVAEHKVKILQHPSVELDGSALAPGALYEEVLQLTLRPQFELGAYKDWELESSLPEVTDQDVETALEEVRRNQAVPVPAGEEGLADDGMALATVELLHQDAVVFQREGLRINPKTEIPGVDAEQFGARMRGLHAGQSMEVEIQFPADFEVESARGQTGTCRVTVKEAYKIVPPTRAELIERLKLADEPALLARVREKLAEAAKIQEDQRIENALLERLVAQHEFEVPEAMVTQHTSRLADQARAAMSAQGVEDERVEKELESQTAALRERAVRQCRTMFLVEQVAEAEKLGVQQQELSAELGQIAERNQTSFDEVASYYKEQGLFGQLALEILERKVKKLLREKARLKSPPA